MQQVISAPEREIIKTTSVDCELLALLFGLSPSPLASRGKRMKPLLPPRLTSSQPVVTLSVSQVASDPATSHCELMCCHPGLTAAPNSLRPWMKSILQEPLKPVGVI